MHILGETWSCELLPCIARDRKSTPKSHYTKQRCWCFHKSLFGEEKSVIQISWFLDLFWRWEEKIHFLRNDIFHCLFIRLHSGVALAIKADHEACYGLGRQHDNKAAENLVCHRRPSTKDSEKRFSSYADWLRSIFYLLLLTHFRKTTHSDWLQSTFYCYLLSEN